MQMSIVGVLRGAKPTPEAWNPSGPRWWRHSDNPSAEECKRCGEELEDESDTGMCNSCCVAVKAQRKREQGKMLQKLQKKLDVIILR